MGLTIVNRFNKLNFEDMNISGNLDSKIQADFYGSALKKATNVILTNENSLCLRKGMYRCNQPFSYLDPTYTRMLLDLNSRNARIYALVGDSIYALEGDTTLIESDFLLDGTLDATEWSAYHIYGDTEEGIDINEIQINGCIILIASNNYVYYFGKCLENRTASDFTDVYTLATAYNNPSELYGLKFKPRALFFQNRLVVGYGSTIRMSRSIAPTIYKFVSETGFVISSYQKADTTYTNQGIVIPGAGAALEALAGSGNTYKVYGARIRMYSSDFCGLTYGPQTYPPMEAFSNYNKFTTIIDGNVPVDFLEFQEEIVYQGAPYYVEIEYNIVPEFGTAIQSTETHFDVFDSSFVEDTDAISFELSELVQAGVEILWLEVYKDVILIGTGIGLYFLSASSTNTIVTPSNVYIRRVNDIICGVCPPIIINNIIYLFDKDYRLLAFNFDWRSESIQGTPLDIFIQESISLKLKSIGIKKMFRLDSFSIGIILNTGTDFFILRIRDNKVLFEEYKFGENNPLNLIYDALFLKTSSISTDADYNLDVLFFCETISTGSLPNYSFDLCGLNIKYDYFNSLLDFSTEVLYLDYLQDYRVNNCFLDMFQMGAIKDYTVSGKVICNPAYLGYDVYIQYDGIIYGPYDVVSINSECQFFLPDSLVSLIQDNSFFYGFAYTGNIITSDIENPEYINSSKKILDITFFLYNSGNFEFKMNGDEYGVLELVKSGQIVEAMPALYTGRYTVEGKSYDSQRQNYMTIQTKIGEPFHLTGLQFKIQEETER